MSAYPTWTPASRPGIVPLHPLGFGMLLGRSFAALRHNPRVLLGFALAAQGVAYLITVALIGAASFALFSRLDNVPAGSSAYREIMAGSVGMVVVIAIVLSVALGAFTVLVQAVVVVDVARGVLAERPTLREIWAQVRTSAWSLIGYAALLVAAALAAVAVAAGIIVLAGITNLAAGIITGVLVLVAAVPVWLWLSTKLALVPAAIVLEKATARAGIVRSWQLTRGRFWPVLGVIVIVQAVFTTLAEVVAVPFSLLGGLVGGVVSPTGDGTQGAVLSLVVTGVVQMVVLLIQLVGSIVQSTACCLLYVDCRMRREGLDLDLLGYLEQRDAGHPTPTDPFTVGIGRMPAAPFAPVPFPWGPPPGAQAPAPTVLPTLPPPATPPPATPSTPPSSTPPLAPPR